jgi:hypothetical protein
MRIPRETSWRLERHWVMRARSFDLETLGKSKEARMPIMAMTVNNSMRVKPETPRPPSATTGAQARSSKQGGGAVEHLSANSASEHGASCRTALPLIPTDHIPWEVDRGRWKLSTKKLLKRAEVF